MKLIINDFDKLEREVQHYITDFIAGDTSNFEIIEKTNCDSCSKLKYLQKVDTTGGIIRVCNNYLYKK